MRSIGQLARESGLSVSALRFYDGAGVFGPARVDPQTGYRWYAPAQLADARLICRLRRVGLPLADLRLVLAAPTGSATAHEVLDAHLRRLEDGLADARRELSRVRVLLDQREHPMTTVSPAFELTVNCEELAAALAAVRFAVSADPELPMLAGVLFDLDGELLRLVATDRYRIAVAQAPGRLKSGALDGDEAVGASGVSALVPIALADEIHALAAEAGAVELALVVEGGQVRATADGRLAEGPSLDLDFPDYRSLLRLESTHRVGIAAAELRSAVTEGATRALVRSQDGVEVEVTVLEVDGNGSLRISTDPQDGTAAAGDGLRIAVNREFLLEALAAGAHDQLMLELGGPISPLAIRSVAGEGAFSVLMPVRLP